MTDKIPESFELDGFQIQMKIDRGDWVFKINSSPWLQSSTRDHERAIELVHHEIKQRQTDCPGTTCPWCDGKGTLIYQHPGWQYEGECQYCDGVGTIPQIEFRPLPQNGIDDAIDCLTNEQLRAISRKMFS